MTAPEAIGIGLGFLAIVAPEFWPKMPRALSYTIAGVGLALLWQIYSRRCWLQIHFRQCGHFCGGGRAIVSRMA